MLAEWTGEILSLSLRWLPWGDEDVFPIFRNILTNLCDGLA